MTLKFITDESTGIKLTHALLSANFDCISIIDKKPGMKDIDVLSSAVREKRILISNDKDFGELIHRKKLPHYGVIFLRLEEDTPSKRIEIVKNAIDRFGEKIKGKFFVASEKGFRIR